MWGRPDCATARKQGRAVRPRYWCRYCASRSRSCTIQNRRPRPSSAYTGRRCRPRTRWQTACIPDSASWPLPVAAFANFRRITRRGGRLAFVCWRSLEENELDLVPLQAAGLDFPIDKTPFKFERRDYLFDVLRSAGFAKIEIEAFDARVSSGNLDAMMAVLTKVGALGKLLRETPALISSVEPKVRAVVDSRYR
jgi:hypothetical protein